MAIRLAQAIVLSLALWALPATANASTLTCGDALTASVTLTEDLVCAGNALTVEADNVDIDLAGYSIIGDGTGVAVSVRNHIGVTVRNGTIGHFSRGLDVTTITSPSSQVTATDVRFDHASVLARNSTVAVSGTHTTCLLSGAGAQGTPAKLTVDGCTVTGRISLYEANYSAIRGSELTNGLLTIGQSDRGIYTDNVFDNFPVDIQTAECRRNLFSGNVFKNAATAFIADAVFQSQAASVVEDNVFTGNDIGLSSTWMFRNWIVRDNLFQDNRTAGAYLENYGPMISPDAVSGNRFIENGHAPSGRTDLAGNPIQGGLHLVTGSDPVMRIKLTGNVGTGNAGLMIWAPPGQVVDGGGNQGPCGPTPNPDLTCW